MFGLCVVEQGSDTKERIGMVDRLTIREKLLELEKLKPALLEEAMRFIEYLIHREKDKQSKPEIYDTNEIKYLSDD